MSSLERPSGATSSFIAGDTRILGVFGCPVEHSLSPAMHNAAIAALGIHYAYIPFSVLPEDIGPAIRSLIPLGIRGVNLTIPHKERVLPFLDEISPEAQAVGAVNTVHNRDGRLVGYNTDGEGFIGPLTARGFTARGKRAVVLGAGGAARSVVYRLARDGASVTLVNRTADRAERLAKEIAASVPEAAIELLDPNDAVGLARSLQGAELLVNTTSVGMFPHVDDALLFPPANLHPGLLVVDLIYNPSETRLLAAAREAGAPVVNGVPMLVYQGAAAFEIWTGARPPVQIMQEAVEARLAERAGH